jgi:hypothetical protein
VIRDISAEGIRVETDRSSDNGTGPQLVPAALINRDWEQLQSTRQLRLRETSHRRSFSCALFSLFPELWSVRPARWSCASEVPRDAAMASCKAVRRIGERGGPSAIGRRRVETRGRHHRERRWCSVGLIDETGGTGTVPPEDHLATSVTTWHGTVPPFQLSELVQALSGRVRPARWRLEAQWWVIDQPNVLGE